MSDVLVKESSIAPVDGAELSVNQAIDGLAELFREPYASEKFPLRPNITGDLLQGTPEEWRALRRLRILQVMLAFVQMEPDFAVKALRSLVHKAADDWEKVATLPPSPHAKKV